MGRPIATTIAQPIVTRQTPATVGVETLNLTRITIQLSIAPMIAFIRSLLLLPFVKAGLPMIVSDALRKIILFGRNVARSAQLVSITASRMKSTLHMCIPTTSSNFEPFVKESNKQVPTAAIAPGSIMRTVPLLAASKRTF